MVTWFLYIVYLTFISLGLPDSMLGAAWPVIWPDFDIPFGSAGILSMIVSGGTIISSLLSGRMIKIIGTGKLALISCFMTAGALLGFSIAPSIVWFAVFGIPLGLGGGSIDAALNHYVAENYKAHHMNWLHCFWGVGATLGPIIMSSYIAKNDSWRGGYAAVSIIQFALVVILFISLPLWKRVADKITENSLSSENEPNVQDAAKLKYKNNSKVNVLKVSGVKYTLLTFLLYCGVEFTVGLWGASYLVGTKGMAADTAAAWVSFYYGGITVGRLITGFFTMKIHNKMLIRYGQLVTILGGVILFLPLPTTFSMIGLVLIGLGLAPIYPGLIHETPVRFGRENSARLIGYQMAVAYTGSTFLPPIFGLVATGVGIALYPAVVLLYLVSMFVCVEKINIVLKRQTKVKDLFIYANEN